VRNDHAVSHDLVTLVAPDDGDEVALPGEFDGLVDRLGSAAHVEDLCARAARTGDDGSPDGRGSSSAGLSSVTITMSEAIAEKRPMSGRLCASRLPLDPITVMMRPGVRGRIARSSALIASGLWPASMTTWNSASTGTNWTRLDAREVRNPLHGCRERMTHDVEGRDRGQDVADVELSHQGCGETLRLAIGSDHRERGAVQPQVDVDSAPVRVATRHRERLRVQVGIGMQAPPGPVVDVHQRDTGHRRRQQLALGQQIGLLRAVEVAMVVAEVEEDADVEAEAFRDPS
jgi:hypothetical protein